MGVNKATIIGNLGKTPKVFQTSSGITVTKFSVAVDERKGKDETGKTIYETTWIDVVAWRKLGEICGRYLTKGTKVYVEGRIRSGSYTGKDGVKRETFEIHADTVEILTPRSSGANNYSSTPASPPAGYNGMPSATGSQPATPRDLTPPVQRPSQSDQQAPHELDLSEDADF